MKKNGFLEELEKLKLIYEKLDEENKGKLEETIQMVLTKFKERIWSKKPWSKIVRNHGLFFCIILNFFIFSRKNHRWKEYYTVM